MLKVNGVIYDENSDIQEMHDEKLKALEDVNVMFKRPIFNKKRILEMVDILSSTLGVYLNKLEEKQIIYSCGNSRNKKYYFYDLINILR